MNLNARDEYFVRAQSWKRMPCYAKKLGVRSARKTVINGF
jgi:hypothetical protein